MIVQVCSHLPFEGSFQPSHKPANTNGESSFMLIECGILPPGTFFHSKNPSAGTRQGRFLNACRYDGAVSTVSALALMVLYATFGSLAQFGIRPHRKVSKVRCLDSGLNRIARTSC